MFACVSLSLFLSIYLSIYLAIYLSPSLPASLTPSSCLTNEILLPFLCLRNENRTEHQRDHESCKRPAIRSGVAAEAADASSTYEYTTESRKSATVKPLHERDLDEIQGFRLSCSRDFG